MVATIRQAPSEFVTAREAARLLDVKIATLYAYVSRGWVRSVSGSRGRARRYARSDIERLRARHDARAGHAPVAAGALRWGEPVLETRVGEIATDGPRYRGHAAVQLARQGWSFESVAELLWGEPLVARGPWPLDAEASFVTSLASHVAAGTSPLACMTLTLAAGLAGRVHGDHTVSTGFDGARSIVLTCARSPALAHRERPANPAHHDVTPSSRAGSVAACLAHALGVSLETPQLAALERALVVSADHDLNASTFTARVAASAGASLSHCVIAALSTMSGERHGGLCDHVERWLSRVKSEARAADAVHATILAKESVPGFGHPLYRGGDPRAVALLDDARTLGRHRREVAIAFAAIDEVHQAEGELPTLDMGLVTLAHALGLPRGSAAAIFAVGRTAGWIAHAFEQSEAGFLLRPRGQYVGLRVG